MTSLDSIVLEIPEDPIDVIETIKKNEDLKYYLDYVEDSECYPDYVDYVERDSKKIYELVTCTSDNAKELSQIIIYFMSGEQFKIVNYGNYKLIVIKKLLLKWIRYYDYKGDDDHKDEYNYDIDFIINEECISNSIRISLDNINEITCIIKKRRKNIMISAICTSWQHFGNLGQTWNIICMGGKCSCRSKGLLIPKDCDLSDLYKSIENGGDIPDEIYDSKCNGFTDIEYMNFINKMKFIISTHFECAKLWDRQKEEDHKEKNGDWDYEFRSDIDYDSDADYLGLTDEQSYHRFYSLLDFSRYH